MLGNVTSTPQRVNLEPGFILHSKAYRDTSLLLEIFSAEFGRLSLVAKGAKGPRSKFYGLLQPFYPLLLSWSGKGELQTLTGAELQQQVIQLAGKSVMSGFYVNELLMRLVTRHDPHPDLFQIYQLTLYQLQNGNDEVVLRRFERMLLQEIGYGLLLEQEADSGAAIEVDADYYYDIERGPVKSQPQSDQLLVKGQTLIDLASDDYTDATSLKQAKQLMRMILWHYLGGKPLKTQLLNWYKTI